MSSSLAEAMAKANSKGTLGVLCELTVWKEKIDRYNVDHGKEKKVFSRKISFQTEKEFKAFESVCKCRVELLAYRRFHELKETWWIEAYEHNGLTPDVLRKLEYILNIKSKSTHKKTILEDGRRTPIIALRANRWAKCLIDTRCEIKIL